MSLEIAWKQNILVTDSNLLQSPLLVVFGFGSQAFVCGFSRQNINSVGLTVTALQDSCSWSIVTSALIKQFGLLKVILSQKL